MIATGDRPVSALRLRLAAARDQAARRSALERGMAPAAIPLVVGRTDARFAFVASDQCLIRADHAGGNKRLRRVFRGMPLERQMRLLLKFFPFAVLKVRGISRCFREILQMY